MSHSTDTLTLARWMAGDFSNQEQAIANPPFFAHIRVCMRPLPQDFFGGVGFFLEQAYDFTLHAPYRLRVFHMQAQDDHIKLIHYKLKEGEKFHGAARDRDRLQHLSHDDLEAMPGCNMVVTWNGKSFQGVVESGKGCIVVRNGKESYLDNTFEISADQFLSLDRGRDPVTDEQLWGSVAGAFRFQKRTDFAAEV